MNIKNEELLFLAVPYEMFMFVLTFWAKFFVNYKPKYMPGSVKKINFNTMICVVRGIYNKLVAI